MRRALGPGSDSFFLLGPSWGGVHAPGYALAHPGRLEGLVVSNMMASIPAHKAYARDVLTPGLDPAALAEIRRLEAEGRTDDPAAWFGGLLAFLSDVDEERF